MSFQIIYFDYGKNKFLLTKNLQNWWNDELRFWFLRSFKGVFASRLQSDVKREILIMAIQLLADTFSTVRKNRCSWLGMLSLGANDVSADRPKSINVSSVWEWLYSENRQFQICPGYRVQTLKRVLDFMALKGWCRDNTLNNIVKIFTIILNCY